MKALMKKLTLLFVAMLFLPISLALAKGDFDYLTVKGPGLQGELNLTNPELTSDFFAFADFTKGDVPPPADPGQGYEITRVYISYTDSKKPEPTAFDQLYYFPYADNGYVYYVGLAEGTSEYDGKWYAANPAIDAPFRAALAERARINWIPFAVLSVLLGGFFIAYNRKPKKA